ncbi:hypothetical protein D9V29_13210 [Mycetocola manganoxydans]|uniref:Acyltransferase n=1 Tax=Mycetocola manganoxydans TaxID=699879 RepID=A0A3L6ZLY8_9MICO|nr:DapH/DapD/GlmU-related protein [Mycetocola manganoxydans]RLP68675.1 hypothetical protein D9V29_13210 [Mycetocola manganoxydans]GHD45392.1 hypothetical protein GCM10008097_14610 [Mycetocola manganoxydans]
MNTFRAAALLAVWLLPASQSKNRLLRRLGHEVHAAALARPNVVWKVDSVVLASGSRIGKWNLIKNMRAVTVGASASVGRLNVISAHPVYARLYPSGASLTLGANAYITSRHQMDCSGSLSLGEFSALAGHDSRVMSHSVDMAMDAQVAHPVVIGDRSFVGTRCLLLGGASLPDLSVLAAGSVLTRGRQVGESGLWAGVPAKHKGPVTGAWFTRTSMSTNRVYIPETGATVEDAI